MVFVIGLWRDLDRIALRKVFSLYKIFACMLVLLKLITLINSIQRLRDLAKVILEADIPYMRVSVLMLMYRLYLLLDRLKQIDNPAVHSVILYLFFIPFS